MPCLYTKYHHLCVCMYSKDLDDLKTRLAHVRRLHLGDPEQLKKAQMDRKRISLSLSLVRKRKWNECGGKPGSLLFCSLVSCLV